jgi:hypothetical protein
MALHYFCTRERFMQQLFYCQQLSIKPIKGKAQASYSHLPLLVSWTGLVVIYFSVVTLSFTAFKPQD